MSLFSFIYDSIDRLKEVQEPGGIKTTFEYDKAGNRTAQIEVMAGAVKLANYSYNNNYRTGMEKSSGPHQEIRIIQTTAKQRQIPTAVVIWQIRNGAVAVLKVAVRVVVEEAAKAEVPAAQAAVLKHQAAAM
ncbi:RHS repeat domain-containing protein [Geosporobacter ferrireducens]|uniref:Uncharacterized protein n=1 Tax=Geosporobacter ferrireducens TaxID=1424294 RepID=A0A1D8GGH1_9FIRM|nr:RHS repeat domain-containing protein [Geosporobacter ferrireducens]AOT69957.1 hypothetical protein Gferi_10395 [Geosporobacter ferrireducens]